MNTYQQMHTELMAIWHQVDEWNPQQAQRMAERFRFNWKWKRKKLPRGILKELQRAEMFTRVMSPNFFK